MVYHTSCALRRISSLTRIVTDASGAAVAAVAAFQRAPELNPEEPSAIYLLATTLRDLGKAGQSKAALDAFRRVQSEYKARQFRTLVVEIQGR